MTSMQNLIHSKFLHGMLLGIAVLVVLLAAFEAGMLVGARRVSHFSHWCEQNERMFAPPGPAQFFNVPFSPDGHGVFGNVLSTSGTSMTVEGQDGIEHVVIIVGDTLVRRGQDNLTSTDVHPNDHVGVFGDPDDDGDIEAKLIRIFP